MKLKKIIIGLFATIGVLSVLACLVGIGYLAGSSTSIPELLNFAKPATGSPEVSTENTETLNENATGNTDLGTLISADRGSSQGNVVSNITPTPGGTQGSTETPSETPTQEPDYTGFSPDNIIFNADNTVTVLPDLVENLHGIEAFQKYTLDELTTFVESISDNLKDCETTESVYEGITKYAKDEDLLDYLTGHYKKDIYPTATPTPVNPPKQEELTFTAMDDSISWFPLTAINVWSEATDFGKKVGTLEGRGCLVVVDSVCNETGYYHVLYAGPTDTDFSEGYIHPDHFQYLTTAEAEYEKKQNQNQGLGYGDGLFAPTATPSPAPTSNPKPTEAPVETPKPTEAPVETPKPTEAPVETPKPTAKPSNPLAVPSTLPDDLVDNYSILDNESKQLFLDHYTNGIKAPETLNEKQLEYFNNETEEDKILFLLEYFNLPGFLQERYLPSNGGNYGGGTFEGGIH